MKIHLKIFAIVFSQLLALKANAQNSPIFWLKNTIDINIDTTWNVFNNYNSKAEFMFLNMGKHVTFIDTNIFQDKFITKPNDTTEIPISTHNIYPVINNYKIYKRDTLISRSLPFYYEGQKFEEKVFINLTFGKSEVLEIDDLEVDLTQNVKQIVERDTIRPVSLKYKHYIKITNLSKDTIQCTKSFIAWNDAQYLRSSDKYVDILPGATYSLLAELNMDLKYRFNCEGQIEIITNEGIQEYKCRIFSKHVRK